MVLAAAGLVDATNLAGLRQVGARAMSTTRRRIDELRQPLPSAVGARREYDHRLSDLYVGGFVAAAQLAHTADTGFSPRKPLILDSGTPVRPPES